MSEEEFEFGMSHLLFDEEDEKEEKENKDLSFDEEFLKPSILLYDDDDSRYEIPKKIIKDEPAEIKLIKLKRQEPNEEYLFTATKLLLDDEDDLDNLNEPDDDLFKPVELVYDEDPLEIFNKKREENISITPLKPLILQNDIMKKEKDNKSLLEKEESISNKEEIKDEKNKKEKNKKVEKEIEKKPVEEAPRKSIHFIDLMRETIEKKENEIIEQKKKDKEAQKLNEEDFDLILFGPTKLNYEDDNISDEENELGEEFIKPGFTLMNFDEEEKEKPNKKIEKVEETKKPGRFRRFNREGNDKKEVEKEKKTEKVEPVKETTTTGYKRRFFRAQEEKNEEKPQEKNKPNVEEQDKNTNTGYKRRFQRVQNEKKRRNSRNK